MVRPPCCDKLNVKRGLWTAEEDAKILAYVSKHGTGNWTDVPKKAGLRRCGKSCRLRWTNYLRPDLKHDSFTPQEEELIVKLHATIGSRWSMIAQQLPGRTDNDVKNYWNTKLRKKLSEMGIDPVTHKPFSQLLADYGNIGGLRKSGTRIGSFSRDLKNAFVSKPEPFPERISDISSNNSNFLQAPIAQQPKTEPLQECFLDKNMNDHSMDLLDQLQAIKLVTEASKYETMSPHFLDEGSISTSSSSSSTCSTAAQDTSPPAFSWRDFLLEDAFLPTENPPEKGNSELSVEVFTSQAENVMLQAEINYESAAAAKQVGSETSSGFQAPAGTTHTSFVEAILDREHETFLDFPNLLEEAFYY